MPEMSQESRRAILLLQQLVTCHHGNQREIFETGIYLCHECGAINRGQEWEIPLFVKALKEVTGNP